MRRFFQLHSRHCFVHNGGQTIFEVALSPTAYKKRTGQFLRVLHVCSIDSLVAFALDLNDLKGLQMSLCVSDKSTEVI